MAPHIARRTSALSLLAAGIASALPALALSAPESLDPEFPEAGLIEAGAFPITTSDDAVFASASRRMQVGAGGTIVVENCDDAGPGSLRQAFLDAVDGTLIDATNLTNCPDSKITLLTGELSTSADVTLKGPGKEFLEITAGDNSRVIAGKYLQVSDVTISHGAAERAGGCIFAADGLVLENSRVSYCEVRGRDSTLHDALGGAIYSGGELLVGTSKISRGIATTDILGGLAYGAGLFSRGAMDVRFSVIGRNSAAAEAGSASGGGMFVESGVAEVYGSFVYSNFATSHSSGVGSGGGLRALETAKVIATEFTYNVTRNDSTSGNSASRGGAVYSPVTYVFYSTFRKNKARGDCYNCVVSGGAIYSANKAKIEYSSFVSNHATGYGGWPHQKMVGGAIAVLGSVQPAETSLVSNSTFYGNYADYHAGATGIAYGGAFAVKRPITISSSTIAKNSATHKGGGLSISISAGSPAPTLTSVILANNEANLGSDIAAMGHPATPYSVAGGHNLVMSSGSDVVLPADTLTSDPHLLPINTLFGWWNFHLELAADSPAIDHGIATSQFDQRLCWYKRDSGNAPDIGAFEVQFDHLDNIFGHGFETTLPSPCPVVPP